jgi:hypothetical protein
MTSHSNAGQTLFRTVVPILPNPHPVSHGKPVFSIGSCFSEHISERLSAYRFDICSNPAGVLFNPLSISRVIRRILSGKPYKEDELFRHDGMYRSFDHHTSFTAVSALDCRNTINEQFIAAVKCLNEADTIIITLGTAFAYRLNGDNRVVANCHKLPHNQFTRTLCSVAEIVDDLSELLRQIVSFRPGISVIFTVSPVRHLRDNPHENQVGKAHLISAVYELERSAPYVYYFPAYEIFMDELRDYRFYAQDMVHPAPAAQDYVWQRFCDTNISIRSQDFIRKYTPILEARSHRVKHADTESSGRFPSAMMERIELLSSDFPEISLEHDRRYFASLL